jgi:phosphomannomutase
MHAPRAVLFDLDDTLAESFKPPRPEMIEALAELLEHVPTAILTAAGFPRIERDFLSELSRSPQIERLYLFPNSSAECLRFKSGEWVPEYDLSLTDEERARIARAMEELSKRSDVIPLDPRYSPKIIDRGAQVAFAALGFDAPLEAKQAWDPDQSKRRRAKVFLEGSIPGFEILIGGMTTIDVTKKGVTKAHGVLWLSEHLRIPPPQMLFVGDALYPGGNDEVVIQTGIRARSVQNPDETLTLVTNLLESFRAR